MKWAIILIIAMVSTASIAEDSGGGGSNSSSSQGSGDSGWGGSASREMRYARGLIEKEKYKAAIQTLRGMVLNNHQNADAWNLLGFSQRKLGKYRQSGKSYAKALKLNPEHKGALEYQGRLFVTLNELDKARDNQRRLNQLCPEGCEELTTLTTAITEAGG